MYVIQSGPELRHNLEAAAAAIVTIVIVVGCLGWHLVHGAQPNPVLDALASVAIGHAYGRRVLGSAAAAPPKA